VARVGLDAVDLIRFYLLDQLERRKAAHSYSLINTQNLDLSIAVNAMAKRSSLSVDLQDKRFKAFGRDQNFLCDSHGSFYNRP
jgi:hypothetical protein